MPLSLHKAASTHRQCFPWNRGCGFMTCAVYGCSSRKVETPHTEVHGVFAVDKSAHIIHSTCLNHGYIGHHCHSSPVDVDSIGTSG